MASDTPVQAIDAQLSPIAFSVKEKEQVNVPVLAGTAAIMAGGAFQFFGGRKS